MVKLPTSSTISGGAMGGGGGGGARGVQCLFASLFCRSAGWPIS